MTATTTRPTPALMPAKGAPIDTAVSNSSPRPRPAITVSASSTLEEARSTARLEASGLGLDYQYLLDDKLLTALNRPVNEGCSEGYRKLVFAAIRELNRIIRSVKLKERRDRALLNLPRPKLKGILQYRPHYLEALSGRIGTDATTHELDLVQEALEYVEARLGSDVVVGPKDPAARAKREANRKARADYNRQMAQSSGSSKKQGKG